MTEPTLLSDLTATEPNLLSDLTEAGSAGGASSGGAGAVSGNGSTPAGAAVGSSAGASSAGSVSGGSGPASVGVVAGPSAGSSSRSSAGACAVGSESRGGSASVGAGVKAVGVAGCRDGSTEQSGWAAVTALLMSLTPARELGDPELEDRLRLVGRCESRLAAVKAETIAELSRRKGEARAADVLRDDLKESKGGAKRQVREAGRLGRVPSTAQALGEGVITPQHARLIAEAAEQAPEGSPIDEGELLAAAQREPADLFGATVREQLNERTGDDLEARRERQRAQRRLSFKHQPDGMFELFGRFDPVTGARIETALTAVANRLWHGEDPKARATPQQRLADALEVLVTRGGSDNGKGNAQGVDLLVIADYDTLAERLANPRLADGTPLSVEELLRLACDARILPAIFDQKGQPLWLGRGKRHATAGQRALLAARDGGCVGCGTSPNWCQAHHIRHWEHGGPTDIDNLCLLCSHCHHQVHERGAQIVRRDDGRFGLEHPAHPPPPHHRPNRGSSAANPDVKHPLRC